MNGNANTNSAVVVSATNNANVVASANKRKIGGGGRPNSTRIPKNKGTMDRPIAAEGIYSNPRFMNAVAVCLGCVVRVHTVNGECYEGIFRTFSNTFECVLQMCHKIDPNNPSRHGLSLAENDEIINSLIFKLSDVICITVMNADLDYATKDMFATDTIISKFNGQIGLNEKELEPWDGLVTETENVSNSLDMDNANGWDVNDMFRTNEQQYGVQSSYDNTLSGYTTQLEKKNTDEYKKQEAKALKLASEIESSSIHRARSALENVDEDEKISAVVRPGENNFGKYVPPPKRKNQQTGKLIRGNTGSNSSSQGGYNLSSGRLGSGGMSHLSHSQIHGGGGPGSGYSRLPHSNNASNNSSGPPQHHSINSQSSSAGHYQHVHRQQSSPPGLNSNLTSSVGITNSNSGGVSENIRKTSHHHHQQLQTQSMVMTDSDARLNCESRVAEKLEVENNKSKPSQPQHSTGESVRREAIAVNDSRNDTSSELNSSSSNSSGVAIHQQPSNSVQMQLGNNNHISQKLSRKTMVSKANRDEETAELKKFQTNFKLPLNEDKEESNNVSTSTADEIEVKDKLETDLDKIANGVKKSSLNPNAKEFVFNPNAKAFTPRTPSTQTPTPPRAHTPGAMMTQPATISLVPGQHYIATTMPPYMMSSSQLATVSLTSPMGPAATSALTMHQAVGPRMRKNDNDHYAQINADGRRFLVEAPMFPFATAPSGVPQRPDFSHVAAATGQPILAPTALTSQPSFVQYGTPQAMVAAHGGPQHNMPYATQMYSVIGPRLMTAQGMSMVSASHLVQHTDPQHVPSQMFLSAHPGVPPQLTPGPTPPHGNHTPIPNMNQSGPHNASSQGQPQQQNQVTSMHPNPSPVHGGNTPTQQNPNNQPQGTPNAQQMNAYSNPHAPNMTSAQLQGAPHTPNSPQSMHPGQVNNSNPTHYLQAVAHAAASNASPHANQAHQHPSQGGFPGTQMVLLPPPGPGTPTSITGHPTMNTHTLQGHALGHGGVAQLVPHASMVIPASSAGQLQAGAHQLFMPHHGGRPNALPGRVVCAVPTQSYQL